MFSFLKRPLAFALCLTVLLGILVACASKKPESSKADLSFSSKPQQYKYSFLSEDFSEKLYLEHEAADRFLRQISGIIPDYAYSDLYGVEECYDRIFTDSTVKKHALSALDANGRLTAEHLQAIVEENNQRFYEQGGDPLFYVEADDEFELSLCQLIVDTIAEIRARYPDIDYDRVCCNLARLKIFYKTSSLDFASVTPEMVLQLGDAGLQMSSNMRGKTGVRDVIIHEIMHMIQLGCSCEAIEHCSRHVGITYSWDDVKLQGTDWSWFFEGSAELCMCMLTGDEATTYQQMLNYLQSVNLVTFLDSDIPANYAQTISFYSDPNKLFEVFRAESKEEITEVANLMEAIQIIQYMPDEFACAYRERYGIDLSEDDDEEAKVRIALKPAICLTLSKAFYKNLALALTEKDGITVNDVYYLIRVLEAAMEIHCTYSNQERIEINRPFLDGYKEIRSLFFSLLRESGAAVNEEYYLAYEMFAENSDTANASFLWLEEDKQEFILERTEFFIEKRNCKIA